MYLGNNNEWKERAEAMDDFLKDRAFVCRYGAGDARNGKVAYKEVAALECEPDAYRVEGERLKSIGAALADFLENPHFRSLVLMHPQLPSEEKNARHAANCLHRDLRVVAALMSFPELSVVEAFSYVMEHMEEKGDWAGILSGDRHVYDSTVDIGHHRFFSFSMSPLYPHADAEKTHPRFAPSFVSFINYAQDLQRVDKEKDTVEAEANLRFLRVSAPELNFDSTEVRTKLEAFSRRAPYDIHSFPKINGIPFRGYARAVYV